MRNHKQSIDKLRGLFTAVMSALSSGLFAFIVLTQLAQQRFAAPAADLGHVNSSVSPILQRVARATVESGAKVSIINFAFTAGRDNYKARSNDHLDQRRRRAACAQVY